MIKKATGNFQVEISGELISALCITSRSSNILAARPIVRLSSASYGASHASSKTNCEADPISLSTVIP